jgi:hypothetical protein
MLGVATGGEGVRRVVLNDEHTWLWDTRRDAEALDDVVKLQILMRVGGLGPAHGQRDPVGGEVRAPAHRDRDTHRYP